MDSADLKFRRSMESYINSYVDMSKKIQNEFREVRGELLRYLDAILTSIRSSYLKNTSRNQIERLIKLIDKAKKQLNAFFYRIQLNTENGKASCLIKQYRQQLYYFNCTASNNSLPNSFDESDHFISGSLQNRLGHRCYVFGTENNISNKFTGHQGNNAFGIENNCGIACVTQLLILSGKRIVENDVVRTAVGCGLCEITGMQLHANGATSAEQRKILLDKHGIRSTIKILSSEQIANYIERGYGIIVSVDAGVLWKKPEYVGVGHAIMVYGTIHKYDTGKLIGLIICDTGSGEMEFPLPIVLFEQMYNFERGANVTLEAIR